MIFSIIKRKEKGTKEDEVLDKLRHHQHRDQCYNVLIHTHPYTLLLFGT